MSADAQQRKKTLFGYVPAQSWVYDFHPLTRLVVMVVFAFMPLAILTTEINAALVGLWILALLTANVAIGRLKFFLPLIVTMFVFMMGTYLVFPGQTGGPVAFEVGPLVGYFEPLMFSLANYWRIIALVFAAILYATTNRERDIIVALDRAVPMMENLVGWYGLGARLASVEATGLSVLELKRDRERTLAALTAGCEEAATRGAEVFVLGCSGMSGYESALETRVGAPVIDPVANAVVTAEGLVRQGLAQSKRGLWARPPEKSTRGTLPGDDWM